MNLQGKRFLVIGGAGFIGSHVVDLLLKENVKEVIVYDNLTRGKELNLNVALRDKRCTMYPSGGDILHTDTLHKAMENVDGVFHLAAVWLLHCEEFPETAFEVNIRGTFNVIMAAIHNKVKRVIYSSSASVYGDALQIPMTEEHPYNNKTFYGATKIAGEHMFKTLGQKYGLEWSGLRYMNVYGPRQDYKGVYTAVMHKIIDKLEEGKNPVLYGDGLQEYDFVFVKDVAEANILAMKVKTNGECYNIGTGKGTTLTELTKLIITLSNSNAKIEYLTEGKTFVIKRIGSTQKAQKELGFIGKTSLVAGMKELIQWRIEIANNTPRNHSVLL